MKAKYQKTDFVFAGNPVILQSNSMSPDSLRGINFYIEYEGALIYTGRVFAPFDIDIHEIVSSVSQDYKEPAGDAVIEKIEDLSTSLLNRKLYVEIDYNGLASESYETRVLPGGVSRQNFKLYAEADTDAFEARFLREGNFFFTTRTGAWELSIPENELSPLYFITHGENTNIHIRDIGSDHVLSYALSAGVWAFNPDMARQEFLRRSDRLVNVFDIYRGNLFACRVIIRQAEFAKEGYRIRFRNSFGVFETKFLQGALNDSRVYPEQEDLLYRRFDPVTRDFSSLRDRQETKRVVEISTPCSEEDRRFLEDLIGSQEVYLLDAFPIPVRVNVSSGESIFRNRQVAPEFVDLKLEFTESERLIGDMIDGIDASRRSGIFSILFDSKFN